MISKKKKDLETTKYFVKYENNEYPKMNLFVFGTDVSIYNLVESLKHLEIEDLDINTENGVVHVHFVLSSILGDNIALNSVLGFAQSISAKYYCRICKISKTQSINFLEDNKLS